MSKQTKKIFAAVLIVLGIGLLAAAGWMWFDANIDRSGWQRQEDGSYSYRDFHGKKITGWLELEDRTCYFDENFTMVTSWQTIQGNRYYFGGDGVLAHGWLELEEGTYYMDATGAMQTGWQKIGQNRYYFSEDGRMQTGWQDMQGSRYYFQAQGQMTIGWLELDQKKYYFGDQGQMLTGLQEMEDGLRSFREDGSMVTGWVEEDDGRYYYDAGGLRCYNWQEIEGKYYYLDENGRMQTGWHLEGEYSYYLLEDGSAAVGRQIIDGQTYYFTPKGIMVILVNKDNPIPSYYEYDIVVAEDYHQIQRIAKEPLLNMLADCRAAVGSCIFNSAYRTRKQQLTILETRTEEYIQKGMTPEQAYTETLKTVALPDTSEHQLGLSCDLVGQEANAWLAEHCWEYGFILRYPEGKKEITGIINEPWHFRYVGTRVSLDMKDTGLCLEEYLGAV